MKKMKCLLMLLGMVFMFQLCIPVSGADMGSSVLKTAAKQKQGLKKESGKYYYYVNGKRVKNTWKTVSGKRYYFSPKYYAVVYSAKIGGKLYVFQSNGQLAQPAKTSIVNVGNNSYYVNKNGQAYTGWLIISKRLYYADSMGKFYKNRTYAGVTFSNTGAAADNIASRLKIKNKQTVASITNSKMTKSQKLRACWNYMVSSKNFSYWPVYPNLNQKGWQKTTALNMLNTHKGNCYSFACGFASLASELGYTPYVICGRVPGSRDDAQDGMTRHCWVKISGRYYDPEAQFAGWMKGVYGASGYDIEHEIQKTVNFAN